ncbi:MAG: sulfatase-like hydrolase/transferase [Victivallaceae bacterium]|nr:sulfatase-like hydrolase/transferase [Victivallaceae bacterium]
MSIKPNIIIFCTDHQRADYLSCAEHPLIKTPNLDRLAARGVRYENLYVQNTICMPSRASILTGTYPCRHTVTCNGYNLPETDKTIAHVLRDAGYHTMAVGRTHVVCTQPRPKYSKTNFYGFNQCTHAQVYCGDTDPDNDYLAWIREEHAEYYDDIAFANRNQVGDLLGSHTEVPEELSMNSWVVGRSLEFIEKHNEKSPKQPFLLWAGTWDPHSPYRAPEPWGSMYDPADITPPAQIEAELEAYPDELKRLATVNFHKNPDIPMEQVWRNTRAMYMGMISHIDDQFGKLLDGLDEMRLTDDTIILFTSDHGDMMGEHWFSGKRIYFYDGALKVPGIMAGPGIPQGETFEGLAESVDLMPTLLDLVSVPVPAEVQGKSWHPLMVGDNTIIHDDVYTEIQHFNLNNDDSKNEHVFSIFDGRYRIVYFNDRPYGQLFDFSNDPGNHINRWDDPNYAGIKQEMQNKLMNRIMRNLTQPDTRLADW